MLSLSLHAVSLTAALVDVASESRHEQLLTDQLAAALAAYPALSLRRDGNVLVARTQLGHRRRVVLAGHTDTVPIAGNVPSRRVADRLFGCGSSDMKSGLAVMLRIAHLVGTGALDPAVDLTWICYDCEEIAAEHNGLRRLAAGDPGALAGDLAILLEGTNGLVEGGCQGTLRVQIRVPGRRAHSARSWLGHNAIHAAAPVLNRLAGYRPREPEVDGLRYHEGLNAVAISGGVAGNVIPDECLITVNYRFAPDRSEAEASAHVREVFDGFELTVTDSVPGARPGLDAPLARAFVEAVGQPAQAKLGWTDVARFGPLGVPAVNFGPGDPNLAHTVEESVLVERIEAAELALVGFLGGAAT